jgi:uncharacterized protein
MDKLYVNIADTPYKQAQGLMFVKTMERDRGMLFIFSRAEKLKFWGENTFMPLDIAFVDANGIIRKISHIAPLSKKVVSCDEPCKYAIEANDGYFSENKVEIGDKVSIFQNGSQGHVEFAKKRRNQLRTSGSAFNRRLLAQLMNDDYAYGLNEPSQEQNTEQNAGQETDQNVPTIRKEDLWQYLEDDFDQPKQPDVSPDAEQEQREEDVGDYPLELEQKPEPEQDYPQFNNAFDATEWAQQNGEMMRISYQTQHGSNIVRDVEPHGQFYADTTARQILVTFDATVGDIRAFILKNIRSFAFTGERFEPKFKVV